MGFGLDEIHSLGMTSREEYRKSGFVACSDRWNSWNSLLELDTQSISLKVCGEGVSIDYRNGLCIRPRVPDGTQVRSFIEI